MQRPSRYLPHPLMGLQDSLLFRAEVTLTNAQIKALPSTPIILVPAAGTDVLIAPVLLAFKFHFTNDDGSKAYTNLGGDGSSLMVGHPGTWSAAYLDNKASTGTVNLDNFFDGYNKTFWVSGGTTAVTHMSALNEYATANWPFMWYSDTPVENTPINIRMSKSSNDVTALTGGDAGNYLQIVTHYQLVQF